MLIPSNYYDGVDTLKWGYPWITPESIYWLETNITHEMSAIEFGCGGSTIFLSRFCKSVFTMDNNSQWVTNTRQAIFNLNIINVELEYVTSLEECLSFFNHKYDIAFIDCCDLNRYELVKHARNQSNIIVVDNYDADYVGDTDALFNADWQIFRYDDLHWVGRGTKIYQKIS